jgi:hypothetical protein
MKTVAIAGPPLPTPSQDEQEAIKTAREAKSKRRPAARLGLQQEGKNRVTSASSHSDQDGWRDRLHNAFGTRSQDFLDAELQRILPMFRGKDGRIDTVAVEAVLAVLDGSEPQNEIEAMLVIQMATTHALTMKLSRRLATVDTIEQNDSASVTLTRLQRTFTNQVEALAWRQTENDRRARPCSPRWAGDRRQCHDRREGGRRRKWTTNPCNRGKSTRHRQRSVAPRRGAAVLADPIR